MPDHTSEYKKFVEDREARRQRRKREGEHRQWLADAPKREAELTAEIDKRLEQEANGTLPKMQIGYKEGLSRHTVMVMKGFLLLAGLVSFFAYSVLLLPIVFLYGLLYISVVKQEKAANYGLRKELHIKYIKFDSLIALGIIIMAIAVVGISYIANGTTESMYAGKTEAQIYQMLEVKGERNPEMRAKMIANSGQTMTKEERIMYQVLTLMTGRRELGQNVDNGMTNFGGGTFKRPAGGTHTMPDGTEMPNWTPPENFEGIREENGSFKKWDGAGRGGRMMGKPGMNLSDLPLDDAITQIFKIISMSLMGILVCGGILVICKTASDINGEKVKAKT
jgi:hypothetical protein